jgi:hypothetical protein
MTVARVSGAGRQPGEPAGRAAEELWALLPAVYRQRDAEAQQGGVLRALVEVLAREADVVTEDLAGLYDNWFIETCEAWLVPYIGDLVGTRPLHPVGPATATPRAYAANTVAYRRRKGTPAVLEQLGRDVTGWPASVVEFFQLLATTQYLNHRRPGNLRTPDLRAAAALELAGGPFDRAAHTADARRPPAGRHGINGVGLFVWRLEPSRVTRASARAAAGLPDGCFFVDPTGTDSTLFNAPLPEEQISSLARERHLPGPLRRRGLFDELEAGRAGLPADPLGFFGTDPVVEVFADTGDGLAAVPPAKLTAADLSDPPPQVTSGWRRPAAPLTAALDPVLGRLAFRQGVRPSRVEVSFTYASPGRVGAGPYDRGDERTSRILAEATFVRAVGRELPARRGLVSKTLRVALQRWAEQPPGTVGVIAILDSRTYPESLTVTVPPGSTLLLTAGAWPEVDGTATGGGTPALAQLTLDDRRPHLLGSLTVTGAAGSPRGQLVVDGLLVEGGISVQPGDLGELALLHTTVVPGSGTVEVAGGNTDLAVVLDRCITGPLHVPEEGPTLAISTSVVDGGGGAAVQAPNAALDLDAVTVIGAVGCRRLEASDSLLTGPVAVERVQEGCIRFSYVDDAARTPRRHRCQPDLALRQRPETVGGAATRARLTPQFVATRFGDPGYRQLSDRCAAELLAGSSQRSDMGAYAHLLRPQREANLRAALDEYLRFGLQAGIFHET